MNKVRKGEVVLQMPPYCHSTANVLPQVVTENYVLNTLIVILVLNYAWTFFFFLNLSNIISV